MVRRRKALHTERPRELTDVGPNLVGRMQRLTPDTAASWQDMQAAARDAGSRY